MSNFGYGGRAIMEPGGLNPANDLMIGEQLGNRVRSPGFHIDIDV